MAALDAEPIDLSAAAITVIVCHERHRSTEVVGGSAATRTGQLGVGCTPRCWQRELGHGTLFAADHHVPFGGASNVAAHRGEISAKHVGRGTRSERHRCRDAGPRSTRRNIAWVQGHGIEGHTVFFADGRRLGRVAWLEYGSRSDQPDSLVVRRRFYERPQLVRVPIQMLARIERQDKAVHLDVAYNAKHFFLRQPL